jgi:hypothetical protein
MTNDLRTELVFKVDTYFYAGSDLARSRSYPTQKEAFAAAPRDLQSMERRYAGYKNSYTIVYPTVGGVPGAIIMEIHNRVDTFNDCELRAEENAFLDTLRCNK